jgi:hypothetical protein
MNVVIPESPGINLTIRIHQIGRPSFQKFLPVPIVAQNGGLIDAPDHHRMKGAWFV